MRDLVGTLLLPLLAVAALGCGPDSELVASGKAHACAAAELRQQLAQDPDDAQLQEQLAEKEGLLEAVVETADEGDRTDLRAAIDDAVAEGCD